MSRFFAKKAEVLNHWIGFADAFHVSSLEFYAQVGKELAARQVPQLELKQIEFAEGGPLSEKRVYLRLLRERLVFDVCAAPFGSGFFFSCRTAVVPPVIQAWELLILFFLIFVGLPLLLALAVKMFGFLLAPFALVGGLIFGLYALRNLVAWGLYDLDRTLTRTPVVGPFYERFLRQDTYYRQDTRLMYLETVFNVVKGLAEEVTAAKGVRLIRQYELAPILGELYKPVPPRPDLPPPTSPHDEPPPRLHPPLS